MHNDRFTLIPTLQVRPGMLLVYNKFDPHPPRRSNHSLSDLGKSSNSSASPLDNLKGKAAYSGLLSQYAKKRLQKTINLLVEIAEPKTAVSFKTGRPFTFKVNFITLTLPQAQGSITDKSIKKSCLDPFIKTMRRRYNLRSYVWRAERQFNGNVHFHLTTDTYLPLDGIKDVWNLRLLKSGLMDQHIAKHGHAHPNSTDVHSVQKIKNIASYMVKYMSKSPEAHLKEVNKKRAMKSKKPIIPELHPFQIIEGQPTWNEPISGKVWDCSRNLKLPIKCELMIDSEISEQLDTIVDTFPGQDATNDHCWLFFFDPDQSPGILTGPLKTEYDKYLNQVRSYVDTGPAKKLRPQSTDSGSIRIPAKKPKFDPELQFYHHDNC